MTAAIAPRPGESLPGLLHRLAAAQAYPRTRDFLLALGVVFGRQLLERLRDLELLLGLAPGALDAIAPRAGAADPLLEDRYDRRDLGPVCPHCVAEGGVHRQAWRHAFVSACILHEVQLVESCPACAHPLGAVSGGLTRCGCGAGLADLPAPPATEAELAVAALLETRAHPAREALPPPLDRVTPPDIAAFLGHLAAGLGEQRTGKPGKAARPRTPSAARAWLAPVHPLLADWPEGFDAHVRQRLADGDPQAASAPARLGRWYQRLHRFEGSAYVPFHDRLARVVGETFDGPYRSGATRTAVTAWIPAAEAGRMLRVRPERVVAAVAEGRLDGRVRNSGFGHRHTMVRRTEIAAVAAARDAMIDKTRLREILDIGKAQLRLIEESGWLREAMPDPVPLFATGPFDRRRLDAGLVRIAGGAVDHDGDTVAFADLTLRRTTDRAALTAVCQSVFRGDLPPVRGTTAGAFGTWRFPASAVADRLAAANRPAGLGLPDVARITGWKPTCIAHWCRIGLIEAGRQTRGRGETFAITPAALATFQASYIPLATLARQTGRSSRSLLADLRRRGIETAGSFDDAGARRGHLVRIADLAKAEPRAGNS